MLLSVCGVVTESRVVVYLAETECLIVVCDRFVSHCLSGVNCLVSSQRFISNDILMLNTFSRAFATIMRFTLLPQRPR